MVQWSTKGQCSRYKVSVKRNNTEKKRKSKGKGKGSRPSSSPRRNSLEEGIPDRKESFTKGKPPTCFVFKWVIVQKGILVIAGIHLSVLFSSTRECANFGKSVRSSRRKRLGANQMKECGNHFAEIQSEGEQNFVKKFSLASQKRVVKELGIIQQCGQSSRSPNAL